MKHKTAWLGLLAAALVLSGCARYEVTLTNGNTVTAKSKPRLDPATDHYRFKDASGREVWVPSMRIRSIEAK